MGRALVEFHVSSFRGRETFLLALFFLIFSLLAFQCALILSFFKNYKKFPEKINVKGRIEKNCGFCGLSSCPPDFCTNLTGLSDEKLKLDPSKYRPPMKNPNFNSQDQKIL